MYYVCEQAKVKLKDASGADVQITPVEGSDEILVYVNDLCGSIRVYPNIDISSDKTKVTVNTVPAYVVSLGSIEISEGRPYQEHNLSWTYNKYPKGLK